MGLIRGISLILLKKLIVMDSRLKFLLTVLFIFSCNAVVLSQKKFSATIQFPSQLDKTFIQLLYDNGKKEVKVKSLFSNSQITISDSFYSKYATIIINYLDKRGFNFYLFFTIII